jgi:hypothetical protein
MNTQEAGKVFREALQDLEKNYLPSNHSFFNKLAEFPHEKLHSQHLLGELYLRYQAACHATRVMIYHIPHLDSPDFRVRKFRFIGDDDGIENGDTHHYQLSRAFRHIGAHCVIGDNDFGELGKLKAKLDPATANFLSTTQDLYPKSLGPWCVIETFSDNWMRALMDSLSVCFPSINKEVYFAECFEKCIEERHAEEALVLTVLILDQFPELLSETINGATLMAIGLNDFWSGLENMLEQY